MNLDTILGESSKIVLYERYSVILIFTFVFYSLFYYFMTPLINIKRPDVIYTVVLILIHVVHAIVLKYFHNKGETKYAWLTVIVPMLLYGIYVKYTERQVKLEIERYMDFRRRYEMEERMRKGGLENVIALDNPQREIIVNIPSEKISTVRDGIIPRLPYSVGSSGSMQNQQYTQENHPQYVNQRTEMQYMPQENTMSTYEDPYNNNFSNF